MKTRRHAWLCGAILGAGLALAAGTAQTPARSPGIESSITAAPVCTREDAAGEPLAQSPSPCLAKIYGICIPEIDFRDAELRDVVAFLSAASYKYDWSGSTFRGISIILLPRTNPDQAESGQISARITYAAKDVTVMRAIEIVAALSELDYRLEGDLVYLGQSARLAENPLAPESRALRRKYDALFSTLERICVPEIECQQADIEDIVEYLNRAAKEGYRLSHGQGTRRVKIVLHPSLRASSEAADRPELRTITFSTYAVSLHQAIQILARVAGVQYAVARDRVVIVPADDGASAAGRPPAPEPPLVAKMRRIIIPEVTFQDADLRNMLAFLSKAAYDNDTEEKDPARKGVNIALCLPPAASAAFTTNELFCDERGAETGYRVTIACKHVSVLALLRTIASVCELKYVIEGHVVLIVPKTFPDRLGEEPDPGSSPVLTGMDKIVIPKIEFRQANIHDVVDFLNRTAHAGEARDDSAGKPATNVNLGLAPPIPTASANGAAASSYAITFTARYVSLLDVLRIVTRMAGLKYIVVGNTVAIVPAGYQAPKKAADKRRPD
jgi:hypothetical protein